MRPVPVLALVVLLAGCGLAPPQPADAPTQSVSVTASNAGGARYALAVAVVPPRVDGLAVTREDGSTRTYDVQSLAELPERAVANATDVEPRGVEAPHRTFALEPGSGVGAELEAVPAGSTVAYFLAHPDGSLRASGLTSCGVDAARLELALSIDEAGALHASTHCAS